jgi:Glu-tRNA(Gln) amidotransferase subunit E-like FAD-binding protein
MENKKNIRKELENEAPFLSKIKKENQFTTPNYYFEELPEVMSSKILINKYLYRVFDKLSYSTLIPTTAAIVLFFMVFNFNTNNISPDLTTHQLSELIIEDDYLNIEAYLVYEAYADLLAKEENENPINEDETINYLLENNIDINSIIEEL